MFKGTKEGIAIGSEVSNDGLFAVELALVVGVASINLAGQLGTVIRVGMSGGLDGVVAGRCTLISLDRVMSVMALVV